MDRLPKSNSGQTLLLVLLSMAVVLTIVLSVLARSITDISVTTQEEDSFRAFSAAEAGIEQALVGGVLFNMVGGIEGAPSYDAEVSQYGLDQKEVVYPIPLISGDSSTFWFVSHDTNGNLSCSGPTNPCFHGNTLKVCWGRAGTSANSAITPAIELTLFYTSTPTDYSTTKIARAAIDPNVTRQISNSFASPDAGTCTIGSDVFQFQKTFTLTNLGLPLEVASRGNILQFATVKMLYNTDTAHKSGIVVPNNLPSQGKEIASSGSSGQANRAVNVFQSFGEIPSVFQGAVYSSGGLTK
jgi:hypothetical protein